MIQGQFGTKGELFFEIELIASDGLHLPTDAMLDTGFTEYLAINKQDLDGLNWNFIRSDDLITARGETDFDIYVGKVLFNGQEYEIPVVAGDELPDVLLGTEWLKLFPLLANYQANILTLG